jgi:hypothetical protein
VLKLVDELEAVRVQLGETEFRKGRASRVRKPRSSGR